MSVELPSYASSSGADKPASLDWQLPQAAVSTTHDDTLHDDDRQSGKVARRASEEDLDQIGSVSFYHHYHDCVMYISPARLLTPCISIETRGSATAEIARDA